MLHTIILPKKVPESCWTAAKHLLTLFSYSPKMGGESFSIYINNSLVVEQFVSMKAAVKSIQLNKYAANDEISVRYNHCGRPGNERKIALKDNQGKTLKEWQFQNGQSVKDRMSFKIKEVLAFQPKSGGNNLKLYYYSKELPAGKLLADIVHCKRNQPGICINPFSGLLKSCLQREALDISFRGFSLTSLQGFFHCFGQLRIVSFCQLCGIIPYFKIRFYTISFCKPFSIGCHIAAHPEQ